VVAGGDLITDGFQSASAAVAARWGAYLAFHRALHGRVEAAIGNHDLVAAIPEDGTPPSVDPRAEFCRRLGLERPYRSFDADGYHFILLDPFAVVGGTLKYEGRVSAEQLAWLEADLSRLTQTRWGAGGHSRCSPGSTRPDRARSGKPGTEQPGGAAPAGGPTPAGAAGAPPRGDVAVAAHTFITGGALCGKWWRGAWHGTGEGFGVLTLRPDRVDWEYVSRQRVADRRRAGRPKRSKRSS
jgi:hypothetical protein